MGILTETYSMEFVENHLSGLMHKWSKENDMMSVDLRNINGDMQLTDRTLKIGKVIQTNPKYIELYNRLQKGIEDRKQFTLKQSRAKEILNRIAEVKKDKKNPYLYKDGVIEFTLADRILYELEKESDLYGV